MNELEKFDELVGLVYQAALAPGQWERALTVLAEGMASNAFHLQGWDPLAGKDRLGIVNSGREEALAGYQAYYGRLDPRREIAASGGPGSVAACHHHLDDAFVRASEFYQDYLIPKMGRYSALSRLAAREGIAIQLDLVRPAERQPFTAAELAYFGRIAPHLQRASHLMLELGSLNARRQLAEDMLDVSNLGVLALSASGKVLHANRRGESFLQAETWLRQPRGELRAINPDRDSALLIAFRDAIKRRTATNVDLGRPQGRGRCCVTLMPMPVVPKVLGNLAPQAEILCLVAESGRSRVATVYQLMELFALSPAEARLARSLAQGEGLDAFADAQGIKMTTVKTQLQNVLRKTETASQKDLIRLILSLPAVR